MALKVAVYLPRLLCITEVAAHPGICQGLGRRLRRPPMHFTVTLYFRGNRLDEEAGPRGPRRCCGLSPSGFIRPWPSLSFDLRPLSSLQLEYPVTAIQIDSQTSVAPTLERNVLSADMSTTLNHILDTAADNLRIAKILVQLGLDPNNVTYDAIFNRLLEIVLANITLANMFALVGAIFFVATLLTQTMVPLRVANMIGCAFFAIFGALTGAITTFLLYLLMVPINAYRLRQMLILVKKARSATQGDTSMEWLKPFMTERKYRKGDVLFKKDDAANEMLLTVTGKFLVNEINVELPPGQLMGELGFLTPDNRRTATIECIEDGHVLTITYEKLLEIYFQNPQFGYYFLVLTSQRLLENIARPEGIVAQNKALQQAAAASGAPN